MKDQIEMFGMLLVKGVIAPVLAALVGWATIHLSAWIKAKVRNEQANGVLDRLSQLAFQVVQEVQQTIVSALPDKADKAALRAARDQALATLKSHLSQKGVDELMSVLGLKDDDAVSRLLISYVESAVLSMKSSNGPFTTMTLKEGSPLDPFGGKSVEKTITTVQPGTTPAPTNTQGTNP